MNYIYNQYDINQLSKRIKEMRKLRNYTQQELADKLGVQRQAIINWERTPKHEEPKKKNANKDDVKENTIPTLRNLIDLCETLNCSIDYLLGSGDTPEIEPISKASLYSGISAEIIRYGIDNPDFLNCLNFFMHPRNSAEFFNSITLGAWKKFFLDSSIEEINGELKEKIFSLYDEYISITPFEAVNKETYKKFLEKKLPREKITLKADNTGSKIHIKKCVSLKTYQNFFSNKEFDYSTFIDYLVEHTYEPLSHNMMLEIQKNKLANKFADLFIKFLNE